MRFSNLAAPAILGLVLALCAVGCENGDSDEENGVQVETGAPCAPDDPLAIADGTVIGCAGDQVLLCEGGAVAAPSDCPLEGQACMDHSDGSGPQCMTIDDMIDNDTHGGDAMGHDTHDMTGDAMPTGG